MLPALRTTFAIGVVLSAVSSAEAGGRSALETFPTIANLPSGTASTAGAVSTSPAAKSESTAPLAAAKPESRGKGRRTRYARPDRSSPAVPSSSTPLPLAGAPQASPPATADARQLLPEGREAAARTPAETRPEAGQAVEAAAPTLAALIAKHAAAAGVPIGLAQAVVRIESRGNARAAHAGALGLMQIKAATARAAGFVGSAASLLDADTNLRFGMKVLADAYKGSGGDVCRALMKYQSGHLATHMTPANRTYCSKARAIMAGA